ncbi:MAG: TIGR03009 domain-containing protein [Planctomycetota bacterium]
MMRPTTTPWMGVLAISTLIASGVADAQQAPTRQPVPRQPVNTQPAAQIARQTAQAPARAPFELTPAQAAQLDRLLLEWEAQSSNTKTLECQFKRFKYDLAGAPAGIFASASAGKIKYASPDKGMFRVDQQVFYKGMKANKPEHGPNKGQFGEHWVCNGKEVIEFDRSEKKCHIELLPPNLQGQGIINSPLPFVFNLKAADIKARYWVRQVGAPKPGLLMIEAWPKRQQDRAQYKLVQIVLKEETYEPAGLVLYAPNFDVVKAPHKDIYEFVEVKRNGALASMQMFMKNFIPEKPPSDWKIFRNDFNPAAQAGPSGQRG